jgi:formate hydrogenlyase subunit 3/multisubunit Na+/H+ antiporter MnhD subunit
VTDPILLFLLFDAVALLLTGAIIAVIPPSAATVLTTTLLGLGLLLCVPPLLLDQPATTLALPVGPPGLSLHFALDPLSVFFLVTVLLAGTAIATFQAASDQPLIPTRTTAFCLGATILTLLAGDGATLTLGLAAACAATGYGRSRPFMLIPVLLLAAICLLTPSGYAPRFDAIRTAPVDSDQATAAAALTLAAVSVLLWPPTGIRCWTRDALTAGILVPTGLYLLLRLIVDLSLNAAQAWWGYTLLLAGGAAAVAQAWQAASTPDLDTVIAALTRRQGAIATACIGLAVVARAADLPGSATFALEATCLGAIGASTAGTLTTLAAHTIGTSAGTYRLSRLGGLIHPMPGSAAALSAGLFSLAALPPSLGFVTMWLSFQSILSAPRTGGLLSQLPLAWIAAITALSAALVTAAALRAVGIALLGRPRSPRGAGAAETRSPIRTILLVLAGLSLAAGLLPGPLLWCLADPAIHALTGLPSTSLPATRGLGLLSTSTATTGYLAIPVLALIGLAIGAPILALRRARARSKVVGPWLEGMPPPEGLPFGDPAAQSTGAGFVPALPPLPFPRLPDLPPLPRPRAPAATAGIWLIIGTFAALLLALTATS